MIEVRCKGCGTLLAKAVIFVGAIKCKGCKKIFEYKVLTDIHMTNIADPQETMQKVLQKRNQ